MKVIYFGTPQYAVLPLKAILSSSHKIVAVVSQPDKPVGRSRKIVPTPVKQVAIDNNIPVFQYEKIRKEDVSELLAIDADIIVTCAYGQIIGENILFAKKYGVINLHGSILPKYRGASPVQCALMNSEKTTGVTVLKSDIGMDDGDIILTKTIDIAEDDNAITLFEKLSILSSQAVIEALDQLMRGVALYTKQNHELATNCSKFTPEMSKIDFGDKTESIVGKIKGLADWPTCNVIIDGVYFKIYNAKVSNISISNDLANIRNGEVVVANNKQGLVLKCSDGLLEITELLPINSKKMTAKSYLNGKKIEIGSVATSE